MIRKVPSKAERYFSTGISMITSRGPQGPNVMTAEWTMQISYSPMLIAVFIHKGSHTIKNIKKTKEFGVNVASQEQTTEASVAGGYSGSEIDKLSLKNVFHISKPHKIKTPMIAGCTINAECKLIKTENLGDHVMMVGKVIHIKHDDTKSPLMYHKGRYFGIGGTMEPGRKEVIVNGTTLDFFKNLAEGKFVLKCVGVLVESKNKILVMKWPKTGFETIPLVMPPQGKNHRDYLARYLADMRLHIKVEKEPIMKRFVLKNGAEIQRINFILFKGKSTKLVPDNFWKSKSDEIISNLV
ncbi:putative flavin reductase like protein [Nitrosotalea devaniterrae]|uniref:Putative flavin reductase like protein n=1 Tax=Nitrosotalea devaniterrae TaxID=1078905 RepID=A0A128A351_9ARCH|nr:putative flavin reductase like protein [Candidatus Nitrosotalea devanaterra]